MADDETIVYQINGIPVSLWQAYLNTEPRGSKRSIRDMILLDLQRIVSQHKRGKWKR